MNICIFGDSITEGYYDDDKGGWVNRVKDVLKGDEIFNLGVAGNTTEDLLQRFDADNAGKNPEIIVVAIGINDSIYLPAEKNNYLDFGKFEENLKLLSEKACKLTKNVIFLGLTPVDEELTAPTPWNLDMHYTNDEIERYDAAIRQMCAREKIKYVGIYCEFKDDNYEGMLSDGLHPNAVGHAWIASRIIKELTI